MPVRGDHEGADGQSELTDEDVTRFVVGVDRRLEALEAMAESLDHAVAALRRDTPADPPAPHRDPPWLCASCSRHLATYDEKRDLLRIRHRDLYLWIRVGVGGWVEVVCRHCGEINRQTYTPG